MLYLIIDMLLFCGFIVLCLLCELPPDSLLRGNLYIFKIDKTMWGQVFPLN